MQRYSLAVAAAGLAGGLLYLAPLAGGLAGLPLALTIGQFAPLPLFLVGLAAGAPAAALAGVIGVLLVLGFSTVPAALLFVGIGAVPVAVLCHFAVLSRALPDGRVEWYPAGALLCWLLGIAAVGLSAAFLWFGLVDEGLVAVLGRTFDAFLDVLAQSGGADVPPEGRQVFRAMLVLVPGVFGAVNVLMLVVNGVLAQRLLVRFGKAIRPAEALSELELPRSLGLLLPAGILGAFLDGTVGAIALSLAMLLGVAYFLAGLAVVHALARGATGRRSALSVFYALLTVLLMIAAPLAALVAAVGVLDQLIGLRRRIRGGGAARKE